MTEKNLREDKERTITLSAEVVGMLDAYAAAEGITRDLAARQLIRDALEGAPPVDIPALKGKSGRILQSITKSGARGIDLNALLEIVYGDDPSGGPLWAQQSIYTLIYKANRNHLKPAGYEIKGEHSGNGALGKFRLVRCEAAA